MGTLVLHQFRWYDAATDQWKKAGYKATEDEIRAYSGGRYELVGAPEEHEVSEAPPDPREGPRAPYLWVFAIAIRDQRVPLPTIVANYGPILYLVPEEPEHYRIVGPHGLTLLAKDARALAGSTEKAKQVGVLTTAELNPVEVSHDGCIVLPSLVRGKHLRDWVVIAIAGQSIELWGYETFRRHNKVSRVL